MKFFAAGEAAAVYVQPVPYPSKESFGVVMLPPPMIVH